MIFLDYYSLTFNSKTAGQNRISVFCGRRAKCFAKSKLWIKSGDDWIFAVLDTHKRTLPLSLSANSHAAQTNSSEQLFNCFIYCAEYQPRFGQKKKMVVVFASNQVISVFSYWCINIIFKCVLFFAHKLLDLYSSPLKYWTNFLSQSLQCGSRHKFFVRCSGKLHDSLTILWYRWNPWSSWCQYHRRQIAKIICSQSNQPRPPSLECQIHR